MLRDDIDETLPRAGSGADQKEDQAELPHRLEGHRGNIQRERATAAIVPKEQADKHRPASAADAEARAAGEWQVDRRHQQAKDDCQGKGKEAVRVDRQHRPGGFLRRRLLVTGGLHLRHLRRYVDLQKLRYELDEEHHADNPKGIGDPVTDRCQVATRRLDGGGQARRAGQRTHENPDRQRRGDFSQETGVDGERTEQCTDYRDEHAEKYVLHGLTLEITKKDRPGDKTDSRHKADKPHIAYEARNLATVVAENQRHDQDTRRPQLDLAEADPPEQIAERGDDKDAG